MKCSALRCPWLQDWRYIIAICVAIAVSGCQTVHFHPRIRDAGHGLEQYKTVTIECSGQDNQTLRQRLETTCRDLGYALVSEGGELNLRVFVSKSTDESVAGQVLMIFLVVWNFGVGDAVFRADAKLVEASSGDVLLEFSAKRTGLTNYSATRAWVDAFASTWRKCVQAKT